MPETCPELDRLRTKLFVPVVVKYGSVWIGRKRLPRFIAPERMLALLPLKKVMVTGLSGMSIIP